MSRYLLSELDSDLYPDCCTFSVEDFKFNSQPAKYNLTQPDVTRFDLLIGNFYGDDSYMDLVLMINNIAHRDDLYSGLQILLPTKEDLETFIYENSK